MSTLDRPFGLISISTPNDTLPVFDDNSFRKDLLRLCFCDSEAEKDPEVRIPQKEDAIAIVDFFEKNIDLDLFVVHCDMGACRSPAVGAAASKHYNGDDEIFFKRFTPNMLLFRLILEEFHAR